MSKKKQYESPYIFVRWADDETKIVFNLNRQTMIGTVSVYTVTENEFTLETREKCSRQDFEAARKMPPEMILTILLGR